jgi:hypothetical protein
MAWTSAEVEEAQTRTQSTLRQDAQRGTSFQPKFFTRHEYQTVIVLADLIIPKDERSGSASDAGVPQFMDFMMVDQPTRQTTMRGGLALVDYLCETRFDKKFIDCAENERRLLLDDIAYPAKTPPELQHAAAFFSSFRDLTASGFWSSKMGVDDLQYMGNRFVAEWTGCPSEALEHLGVQYKED